MRLSARAVAPDSWALILALRPRSSCSALTTTCSLSRAPWRRCRTQSAPPASQRATQAYHSPEQLGHWEEAQLGLPVGWPCLLPSQRQALPSRAENQSPLLPGGRADQLMCPPLPCPLHPQLMLKDGERDGNLGPRKWRESAPAPPFPGCVIVSRHNTLSVPPFLLVFQWLGCV